MTTKTDWEALNKSGFLSLVQMAVLLTEIDHGGDASIDSSVKILARAQLVLNREVPVDRCSAALAFVEWQYGLASKPEWLKTVVEVTSVTT